MINDNPDAIPGQDQPLVSVLIPTYNCAPYIGQAIDSVLTQDYKPIEILVADDGSTDGTDRVLERYGNRIRVLKLAHGGVGAARNALLGVAQGYFIAFLDADDAYMPGKISAQVRAMLNQPQVGLCHTGYEVFGDDDLIPPAMHRVAQRYTGRCFEPLFHVHEIHWPTVMLRRQFIPPHGFFEDMPMGEDYTLMLWVLYSSEAVFLPNLYYRYRRHTSQVTSGNRQRWPIYEGLGRLRVLDQLGFRMDPLTRQNLKGLALEWLEQVSYDRYWRGDYGWAHLGFGVLNRYGRKVPLKHRLRAAWQRVLCARAAKPQPVRAADGTPHSEPSNQGHKGRCRCLPSQVGVHHDTGSQR